jgi:HEAT repeat protein
MPLSRATTAAAATLTGPPPLARLLETLRSGGDAARRDAAHDLARHKAAVPALAAALTIEQVPSVQDAIVEALVQIGTETAAAALADLLARENARLRNAGIEALQQMGEAAVAQVERLLASPDPDLRVFGIAVLAELDHPAAAVWLRSVLVQDPEVNVGLAAVEVLAQTGGPEDVPSLRDFAARFACVPFAGIAVDIACRRLAGGAR